MPDGLSARELDAALDAAFHAVTGRTRGDLDAYERGRGGRYNRTDGAVRQRRREAHKLRRLGWTQEAIGAAINVHQTTVAGYLARPEP